MSKIYSSLTLFLLFILLTSIVSCGGNKKDSGDIIIEHLPAYASNVVIMDMNKLVTKSGYQERKAQPEFQTFLKDIFEETENLSTLVQDLEAAGIKLTGKHYAYSLVKGVLAPRHLGVVASPLADKAKLSKALEAVSGLELKNENGVYFGRIGNFVLGYNDNFVALAHGDIDIMKGVEEMKSFLATPKEEEQRLLAAETTFGEFAKANQNDVAIWVSFDPLIKDFFADKKQSAFIKGILVGVVGVEPEELEGSRIYLTVNFEKGQAVWDMNVELNDFLKKELRSPWQAAEAFEFNKNLPDGQLGLLFSTNIDLSKIDAIVKKRNAREFVDSFLKSYGVSYNDVIEGLKGGLVASIYLTDDMGFDPIIGVQIKNKAIVDRFDDIMQKKAGMQINMDGPLINYESELLNLPLQATIKDNVFWIAAGDHQTTLLQIADGGFAEADQIKLKNADQLQRSLFGLHLDRTKTIDEEMEITGLSLAYLDINPQAISNISEVNSIEQIVQYMDGTRWVMNLYLNDKNKNSLSSLFDLIIELQAITNEDLLY
ncbi:MAG: DUF4836 family protein [Saprospiraceae bacterium]|nr:DUF4836 family protein [Saprospiraceae bacterium]